MLAKKEWLRNYRYQGGVVAAGRCFVGTVNLWRRHSSLLKLKAHERQLVECITFSVIPRLTLLWAAFIRKAVVPEQFRVIVGDCSGGFRPYQVDKSIHSLPLLNYRHGKKLDMFLKDVSTAKYVIVSDDDVFCLSSFPWHWVSEQFEADPLVAVVSLMPRDRVSSVLRNKLEHPMGSYCLAIRREIWLQEALSFEIVYPLDDADYDWFYDTADYANVQLLKRGYKVIIAPIEIREYFITFEGVSTWLLKIQENSGDITENVRDNPLRQEKALRAILIADGISTLLQQIYDDPQLDLTPKPLLIRARAICVGLLPQSRVREISEEVSRSIEILAKVALSWSKNRSS